MPVIPNGGGGTDSQATGQLRPGGPRLVDRGQLPGAEQQQQGVQETASLDQKAADDAAPNVPE